jgi:hypothetical protein
MVIANRKAEDPALQEKGLYFRFNLRRDRREHGLVLAPEDSHHRGGVPAAMARTNRSVDGHSTSVVRGWTRTSRKPAASTRRLCSTPSPGANRGNPLRAGPNRRPGRARSPHRAGSPPRCASTRSQGDRPTEGPAASRGVPGADRAGTGALADRRRLADGEESRGFRPADHRSDGVVVFVSDAYEARHPALR